jgi:F-type H+-transporting ATPase subunit epsilon
MAATFKFELVSPERILVSAEALSVMVPGGDGDFTVLPGHAPVISTIRHGAIDVKLSDGSTKRYALDGGLAEVDPKSLTILATSAKESD